MQEKTTPKRYKGSVEMYKILEMCRCEILREKNKNEYGRKLDYEPSQNNTLWKKDSFIKYLDFVMISPATLPLRNRRDLSVMGKKAKSFIRRAEMWILTFRDEELAKLKILRAGALAVARSCDNKSNGSKHPCPLAQYCI